MVDRSCWSLAAFNDILAHPLNILSCQQLARPQTMARWRPTSPTSSPQATKKLHDSLE